MEIFRLMGSIFVDNEKANKSISETDSKAGGLAGKLKSGVATAAKWGAAITGAAVAGGAALFGMANKATDTLDRVDKLSQKIGMSRQGFQEWDYILSQSGTDVEKLQMGFKTLVTQIDQADKGMGKGADNFKRLGINVRDANGQLKDQETVFNEVAIALQNMEDGSEKARIANELLGRSGSELMPLLQGEAGSIEDLRENAHKLGLVMSNEAVDAGVKFQDTMDDLKRALGAIFTGLGAGVIPIFQQFAELIISNLPMVRDIISKVFNALSGAVEAVMPLLISLITDALPPIVELFSEVAQKVLPPVIDLFTKIFKKILPPLIDIIKVVTDKILPPLLDIFMELAELVLPLVIDIFESLLPIIEPIMNLISAVIRTVLAIIKGDWETVWKGLGEIVKNVWDSIVAIVKGAINVIISGINLFIRGVNKVKVPNWVPGIGGKGINIKEIPKLARGGEIEQSGMVLVGEAGPEMLHLPKGAKVSPLNHGSQEIHHSGTITVRGVNDAGQLVGAVDIIMDALDDTRVQRKVDEIGHRNRVTTLRPQGVY